MHLSSFTLFFFILYYFQLNCSSRVTSGLLMKFYAALGMPDQALQNIWWKDFPPLATRLNAKNHDDPVTPSENI